MTQEQKIYYTIKKKDFLNYAEKWFQKELAKTVKQVDDCLAKVQELKEAGDAYPQKVLLPICDIISLYKFDDTCLYDPYYYSYYYYYRDFIEYDVGGGQNNHSKGGEKRPILGKLRNQQLSLLNLFSNRFA